MPAAALRLSFDNPAGQLLEHPAGFAVLRHHAGKRQPADLPALIGQLGPLLLRRGWHRFLADTRAMAPLTGAEKAWLLEHWLSPRAVRPARLWAAVLLPGEAIAWLGVVEMVNEAKKSTVACKNFTAEAPAEAYLVGLARPPGLESRTGGYPAATR